MPCFTPQRRRSKLHTVDRLNEAVDLTNCDREPIHILGTIQPFGVLISLDPEGRIRRVSANLAAFAGLQPDEVLGLAAETIFEVNALAALRERMQLLRGGDAVERLFGVKLFDRRTAFDVAIHFSGGEFVIEAEPASDNGAEAGNLMRTFTGRLRQAETTQAFLREAARQVKSLTGFDRVMVYRFDDTGSGEVVAEALTPGTDSFFGLHYPASDIPAQARRLYLRNVFRVIADVTAEPVPLLSAPSAGGRALDQSIGLLRAVSPIHVEYLRNMGVGASLSISIIVEGQLWGLFACHHYGPRLPNLAMRTTAELFGQLFSFMLESRLRNETSEYELRARRASDRIMATVAQNPALLSDPAWLAEVTFELVPADGVAVFLDGEVALNGLTPTIEQCGRIHDYLNEEAAGNVVATDSIASLIPEARVHADLAAGMLAIPLSRSPRNHIVLFRAEQLRAVRWAGNPEKSVEHGPNGDRLTPRKSFEAWTKLVQGTSLPFTKAERQVAETLRNGMLEVLLRLADDAALERERAHDRQEVLIAELNHRVRNILSLIRGLISQTERSSATIAEFVTNLDGRVQALARAHDQVTHDHWGPASLIELLDVEASAYLDDKRSALVMKGPDLLVEPVAFTALALVFHELMTNAAKYGALSGDSQGTVLISWRRDAEGDLLLDWIESGGPAVTPPTRRGFGSVIIETSIPHDLGGEASIEYRRHGFEGHFRIPAQHVVGTGGAPAAERARPALPVQNDAPLKGLKVLLAEDNMIIALDAEQHLFDLGAEDVVVAPTAEEALALVDEVQPDFAALDFNLGSATSLPVAERLRERGIPFAFMTGLGDTLSVDGFDNVPLVQKPYSASQIAAAAAQALAGTDRADGKR